MPRELDRGDVVQSIKDKGPIRLDESKWQPRLLDEDELEILRSVFPDGITMADLLEIVSARSKKVTEHTVRSYVSQGYVSCCISRVAKERSIGEERRKHRGSEGRYPVIAVNHVLSAMDYPGKPLSHEHMSVPAYTSSRALEGYTASLRILERSLRTVAREHRGNPSLSRAHTDAAKAIAKAIKNSGRAIKLLNTAFTDMTSEES